jgi:hypothetical protein
MRDELAARFSLLAEFFAELAAKLGKQWRL